MRVYITITIHIGITQIILLKMTFDIFGIGNITKVLKGSNLRYAKKFTIETVRKWFLVNI